MIRFVAIFEDNSEATAGWVRKQHADDHFAYLAANSDQIKLGGGLRENPAGWFVGGLWVMECATHAEAVALVEGDPYFKLGLRQSYRLLVWGKAPCYGKVVL